MHKSLPGHEKAGCLFNELFVVFNLHLGLLKKSTRQSTLLLGMMNGSMLKTNNTVYYEQHS